MELFPACFSVLPLLLQSPQAQVVPSSFSFNSNSIFTDAQVENPGVTPDRKAHLAGSALNFRCRTRVLDNLPTSHLEHSGPGPGPCHLLHCRGPSLGPLPLLTSPPAVSPHTRPKAALHSHQTVSPLSLAMPGFEGPAPHLSDLIPTPCLSSLPLDCSSPLTPQDLACGPLWNLLDSSYKRPLCCHPNQNCTSFPTRPLLPLPVLFFFCSICHHQLYYPFLKSALFPLQSFIDRFSSVLFPLSWDNVGHL